MRRQAFTLMELLVAISITLLLMGLIGILFRDTQKAVSQGVAVSRVIQNSRGVGDQFYHDFNRMIGPGLPTGGGGFMVILQQLYPNQTVGASTDHIRSDQILFIADASGSRALAPGMETTFTNGTAAAYSRIWYGHVERTQGDGTGSSPIANAQHAILGRQELLLATAGLPTIHATSLNANAPVNGYTTLPAGLPNQLYMGLTDVAAVNMPALTTASGPLAAAELAGPALYRAIVYPMMFTGATKLRVNPTPDTPDLRAYQVAQQHPYFCEGVSDFIIDLAGDFDTNGTAGALDRDTAGNIKWFGYWYNEPPPTDRRRDPATGLNAAGYDPNAPTIWEPNGPTYHAPAGIADAGFVFKHTTDTNNAPLTWPHMLRIRWRQHDPNGTVITTTANQPPYPGRWFEQIVPVNRN